MPTDISSTYPTNYDVFKIAVQQARRTAHCIRALGPRIFSKPCRVSRSLSQRAQRAGLAATPGRSRYRAGIFISDGAGNVSRIREPEYAAALCEAYNDYVYDHYVKVSDRLRPSRSFRCKIRSALLSSCGAR